MLRTFSRNLRSTVAGPIKWLKSVTFETAVGCNLLQLRFCSVVYGLPIGFTDEGVYVDESLWKRALWLASLGVLWLRTLFVAGAVMLSLTVDRFWNPFFLTLYFCVLVSFSTSVNMGRLVLDCESACFATTWNFILKHKSAVKSPKLLAWLMCISTPSAYVCNLGICLLLAFNPQLVIQFRFAVDLSLGDGLLTIGPTYWALVAFSTVADFWSHYFAMNILCIVCIPQMLCLEAWTSVMNGFLVRCKVRGSTIQVEPVWRGIQELVVLIRVFNTCNSGAIFVNKVVFLFYSISYSSGILILDFHGNTLFLAISLYVSIVFIFLFPALYHRAYGVSARLQKAKRELLKFRQLDRRLRAISSRGVQVGSFRVFERESDLIYWDFIVNQTISVVIALN